jgi:hypothetical protein
MNAAQALQAARAAGIQVKIDGVDLLLRASAPPSAAVLEGLSRHKVHVLALLRLEKVEWTPDDWRAFFDERAGILEFDGGLPRVEAEDQAFACCLVEWLNRNPARSAPGLCLACGDREYGYDPLVPYGVEPTGHAWLHSRCWEAWHAARKGEAVAALRAMGIGKTDSDGMKGGPPGQGGGAKEILRSTPNPYGP